jgi:transposase
MSKYSRELKLIIAKKCLGGEISGRLSEEYSISSRQIRYWTQVFSIHGAASFQPTTHSSNSRTKFKALQLMWTNDWSLGHTSATLNLSSPGTLSVWLRRYNAEGIKGLKNQRKERPPMKSTFNTTPKSDDEMSLKELKEELAYLRTENAVLKKLEELEQKKRRQIKKKR